MRTHPSAINKVFAGADRPGRGKSIGRVAGRASAGSREEQSNGWCSEDGAQLRLELRMCGLGV
jgi:hypothetical protein